MIGPQFIGYGELQALSPYNLPYMTFTPIEAPYVGARVNGRMANRMDRTKHVNMFINRFYKDGDLDDIGITRALVDAVDMYANGEILETRNVLFDIVAAIDRFTEEYGMAGLR